MRFPWTIWRFTVGELARLVLLTSGVVVLVAAFAATVKPMAEGKLGPAEAARFLLLAVPPMLQYVLPFAACFGATLAFHRMASDNELDASRVGGIGFGALLAPAWGAGLFLAACLALLSGEIVPRFLRSMEEIIRQDVTRALVNAVERGESLKIGGVLIFADRVDRLGPDERTGADEVLVLSRVGAIFTDKDGAVDGEVTAGRAWVWLQQGAQAPAGAAPRSAPGPVGGSVLATIRLEQTSGQPPGNARIREGAYTFTQVIPSAFRDDVKYMTWDQLRRLPKEPDAHGTIQTLRRALAHVLAREEFIAALDAELRTQGRAKLTGDDGRHVVVYGSGLARREQGWIIRPASTGAAGGRVEVEIRADARSPDAGSADPGRGLTRLAADTARFTSRPADDMLNRRLALELHLDEVRVLDSPGEGGSGPIDRERTYGSLTPDVNPLDHLLAMPARELMAEAQRRLARSRNSEVAGAVWSLNRRLQRLGREVEGRVHELAAMATSCLLMVLTGCVTAIRLKDRLPMPVYLWSFFPGIGAVLSVNAGKEAVQSTGTPGLVLLWGGLLALAAYTLVVYRHIRRH
ncbi:MAG: LptF/LptG family permease [Phycisphaerales bacterium]